MCQYLGGGFGAGVHSVIEPAIYGNAISFGPNYHILDMAIDLVERNLAHVIHSIDDFIDFLLLLENKNTIKKNHKEMNTMISNQYSATNHIIQGIFQHD